MDFFLVFLFFGNSTHEFMNDIMWQEKMDDPIGTQIDISMPLRSIGAELIGKSNYNYSFGESSFITHTHTMFILVFVSIDATQ